MDDEQSQIDALWQQMRSDNEFYFLMLGQQARETKAAFNELKTDLAEVAQTISRMTSRLDVHMANADERMRQIEGRQRLNEQRFDTVLRAVHTRREFQGLEKRVKALEDKAS